MSTDTGLTIGGSDPRRAVTFDPPVLLAPMEGITDTAFRGLVIGLGGVGSARGVGGACTEFLRIAGAPLDVKAVRRALGSPVGCPVGVQLMAAAPDHVAASVAAADRAGAAFIDLNFGCPAPVVFDKCAGSALLARPALLGAIVREAVSATGLPVSAKVRAGIADASMLGEIVTTIAEAGASMLTVHARLRTQAYSLPATWEWIAEAREHLRRAGRSLPLVGNGGVDVPEDVSRLRSATGCDGVMVGRAALARPFFFRELAGGGAPSAGESARFALRYHASVAESKGEHCATARLKQLLRWSGDALFDGCGDARARLLREQQADAILGWLEERTAAEERVAS